MNKVPLDDTAIHLAKALVGTLVQDVREAGETIELVFENGAKLIIYDAELEDEV